MKSNYTLCSSCSEARNNGELAFARKCRKCKGTGIVRNPETYICNKCGESLVYGKTADVDDAYGLVDANVGGGYFSEHLCDGTGYIFSVCEKCLREFFNECKVPPEVYDYIYGSEDLTYEKDRLHSENYLWLQTNEPVERFEKGICNVNKLCEKPAVWRVLLNGEPLKEIVCDEHKKPYCLNASYEPLFGHESLTGEE